MNTNISSRKYQVFLKHSLNIAYWLGGSTPALFVPDKLSERCTPSRQAMFKRLLQSFNNRQVARISLTTIGRAGGVDRKAAGIFMHLLRDMGIIKFISGKSSHEVNSYFFGEVLKLSSVRWALRNIYTNLTRAYFRMVDALKTLSSFIEKPVDKPNHPRLININVFKRNTSQGDYKEIKLHSSPYIENDKEYSNMKKALWADWSLSEDDYRRELQVTKKEYDFFYKKSDISDEDLENKIEKQAYQQSWNKRKYPQDITTKQRVLYPKSPEPIIMKDISNMTPLQLSDNVRLCQDETDLSKRLSMLQDLLHRAPGASKPYIQILIKKVFRKIQESDEVPF